MVLYKSLSSNGFVRYWAVVSVECLAYYSQTIIQELNKLLNDKFKTVQIEAAKTLIKAGKSENVETILEYMQDEDVTVQLFATRAFEEIWKIREECIEALSEK